jgi:co-chaperonin GroES (HSP10)
VLFGKYSGTEYKEGKDEFVVLREEDIIGVYEK